MEVYKIIIVETGFKPVSTLLSLGSGLKPLLASFSNLRLKPEVNATYMNSKSRTR